MLHKQLDLTPGVLTALESKALLAKYGIPVARSRIVRTAEESVRTAEHIGYPVALKVESPDISHKTEAGGVRLALTSGEAVRRAFSEVIQSSMAYNPEAQIHGVCIEEFVTGGVEVIVGVKRDAVFGPVLMFGLGGIFVELLEDVSVRVLPLNQRDIIEMISEVRAYKVLDGFRGAQRSDVESLMGVMATVAAVVSSDDRILELDLNPLVVFPEGRGAVVIDARILVG